MCLMGTGTSEYLKDGFTVGDYWVTIHGKKNANRTRRTLLVYDGLVHPKPDRKPLDEALHAIQEDWLLYDGRRCFAHWCEMAGIPLIRIKAYMGHVAGNISELYRRHEVDNYLVSDAELLRTYIEANKKPKEAPKPKPVPKLSF